MATGTRVKMLRDSHADEDEFFWRKGDIGVLTGTGFINFNGVEGQAVLDDGEWFACASSFEVLP